MLSTSSHVRTNPWCFLFVSLCSLAWSTTSYWKPNIFLVFTTNWLIAYLAFRSKPSSNWHQLTWIAFQQTFPSICFPEARQYSYAFNLIEPPAIIYSYLYESMEIIHTIPQFYFSHSAIYPTHIPIYPATLALFIAYIFNRDYAPSTVNTYVSALSYSHKLSGLPDPTRVFYIAQMLKGYMGKRLSFRLPLANNTTYPPQFAWGFPSDHWFWIPDLPV